ncbi:MAG: sulfatase [Planctomycetaceae bacterium]|nr:sulfatase [Planctomycetaceae bacterium]
MIRRFLFCLLAFWMGGTQSAFAAAERPNFLIIMADDCTYNDLPIYGGKNAVTPHLQEFAGEGLVFNRAFLASAMCQPCRSELFTGRYPLGNGSAWNHSASRPGIKSLPHHLSPLGYRVGISGKVHVKPDSVFPFENLDGFDPNCVRNPTQQHDVAAIREFMSREQSPFCLVVALVEPHVPWVMGDASRYPPQSIELPPNIADTPATRSDFGRYLAEITYMDGQVGEILSLVDQLSLRENTLVLFTSEQGSQFPGCKWTNWNTGVHTALMARWPGKIPAGKRTDALVQYADVVPTLLDLAGGEPVSRVDGTSFAKVLSGATDKHRQYVYGIHNNLPEGPAYPIRSVSDGEYRYIRNLTPGALYIEKHLMGRQGRGELNNPYWGTWMFHSEQDARTYGLISRYMLRPAEQLYSTLSDPYEMDNQIENAALQQKRKELSAELDRWMESQQDPGIPVDTTEALEAARRGEHFYAPVD